MSLRCLPANAERSESVKPADGARKTANAASDGESSVKPSKRRRPRRWDARPGPSARPLILAAAACVLLLAGCADAPMLVYGQPLAGATVPAWLSLLTLGCGAAAGFLVGLLGIGGSLIVVPAFFLLLPDFGVPAAQVPHTAIASALVAMIPSALHCTGLQFATGRLDRGWLRRMAPGALLGGTAGATFAFELQGPTLALLFVAQSVYYGVGLLRARPSPPDSFRGRIAAGCTRLPCWIVSPLTGGFCACMGMGAGSLTVPYMAVHGVRLINAAATAVALNLCVAVGGAFALVLMGDPVSGGGAAGACWPAVLLVAVGAVSAVPLGVMAAPRLPVAVFRRALGVVNLLGAAVLLARTVVA
jgi:uncharacterized protein